MIHEFEIENFKSHKKTNLICKNLTVFCGSNGVGKSSAIQSLLLLRNSYISKSELKHLDLKSKLVHIGFAKDAIYQFAKNDEIKFKLNFEKYNSSFEYITEKNNLNKTLLDCVNFEKIDLEKVSTQSLFNKEFQYISAARLGPQVSYEKNDVVVEIDKQISVEEGKAEYCIHYLHKYNDKIVNDYLINGNSKINDLINQVSAWEKEISKGVNVEIIDQGNLGFELKFAFKTEKIKTDEFKAINVGFGLSYTLPILVAILSAQKDALIIIENPESHLHPNGISKLTELICLAAQAGIQIIIETHSDHIINGILVQCKKFEQGEKGIDRENVSIYHFDRDEEEHCTTAKEVKIEEDGLIKYPPKGFFDQFSIDRRFLLDF